MSTLGCNKQLAYDLIENKVNDWELSHRPIKASSFSQNIWCSSSHMQNKEYGSHNLKTFDLVFKSKHFPSLPTSLGSFTLAPKLKQHENLPDVPLTTPDKSLYQLERDVGIFCSTNLQ